MRTLFTIACLSVVFTVAGQELEQHVISNITHVTVFLAGAQVTRRMEAPVKKGVSVLTLSGIAPGINQQSIQVDGPSAIKILSVSFRINYMDQLKRPERIVELENERTKLLASIDQERSMEEVYKEEESILKTNKSIGGQQNGVEIGELKVAMDYFRQRFTEIKNLLLTLTQNIQRDQLAVMKIEAQLAALRTVKEHPIGEIIIKVSSPQNFIASNFNIKYVVREARWFPTYDIRARDVQSPVSITYKANVNQQSGEDWNNVSLIISTGNPTEAGSKPVIKPWYLSFNNTLANGASLYAGDTDDRVFYGITNNMVKGRVTDERGSGVPGVNVVIKGTTVGTTTDVDGNYSIPLTSDAQTLILSFVGYASQELPIENRDEINARLQVDVGQLNEVIVTGYGMEKLLSGRAAGISATTSRVKKTLVATPVIRQTNIEYTLDEPFSVKSDGEVRVTEMVEYELDAFYEYYCVPKLDVDAFLTAKVLHWDEYNFLEGEASLFFEGKYIGKSILDTRNTSDTLTLSLGRDGNVLVKREKKKDFSSRQLIGTNQKVMFSYEISIRNKKSQPIDILILDQVPVSGDKDLSVDKLDDSKGEYDKDSGLLKWRRKIAPGKTELINLKYAVRYPKHNAILLE